MVPVLNYDTDFNEQYEYVKHLLEKEQTRVIRKYIGESYKIMNRTSRNSFISKLFDKQTNESIRLQRTYGGIKM